jgi:hypothetical protein
MLSYNASSTVGVMLRQTMLSIGVTVTDRDLIRSVLCVLPDSEKGKAIRIAGRGVPRVVRHRVPYVF